MDASTESVARPKVRSMKFVKQMFKDRNYSADNQRTVFDQSQGLWEIFTETPDGRKVMAVFSECKSFGDTMQIIESTHDPKTSEDFKSDRKSAKIRAWTLSRASSSSPRASPSRL